MGIVTVMLGVLGFALTLYVLKQMNVPPITSLLIAANIGIYLAVSKSIVYASNSVLLDWGSSGFYLFRGRVETLITSMFLHANLVHLALNMYALYYLGRALEHSLAWKRFSFLYFASGVAGNVLSALADPNSIGVGASGAILGLLGYMVALEYLYNKKLSSTTILLVIFVIFGGFSANIDVAAHVGGFVVGFIYGLERGRIRPKTTYYIYYG